jgi:hypothetical protein
MNNATINIAVKAESMKKISLFVAILVCIVTAINL